MTRPWLQHAITCWSIWMHPFNVISCCEHVLCYRHHTTYSMEAVTCRPLYSLISFTIVIPVNPSLFISNCSYIYSTYNSIYFASKNLPYDIHWCILRFMIFNHHIFHTLTETLRVRVTLRIQRAGKKRKRDVIHLCSEIQKNIKFSLGFSMPEVLQYYSLIKGIV